MIHLFKRLLFHIYVFYLRVKQDEKEHRPTFIWKYAWFFFWHRFFWASGRGFLSNFKAVRPLLGEELSPAAHRHYAKFSELAARDYQALPFHERLVRPTRYVLAADTARELCLFYMCIADTAPWQYGVEARYRALVRMRSIFLIILLLFVVICNLYVATPFYIWSAYLLFNALMLAGVGWYADSCLLLIAKEGERVRKEMKQ